MITTTAPQNQQEKYHRFLKGAASLGKMFTSTDIPVIPSALAEIIFEKAFTANRVADEDKSFDIIFQNKGIGIKTFRGTASQKVAEFNNRDKYPITMGRPEFIVQEISQYRNQRIIDTSAEYEIQENQKYYHYTRRTNQEIQIFEKRMRLIDTDNISDINTRRPTSVAFCDGRNFYRYHYDKSTLYMKLDVSEPILSLYHETLIEDVDEKENISFLIDSMFEESTSVVIPLFNNHSHIIYPKSGLNQWNASGRIRNLDEVYIPIPSFIHLTNPEFFPSKDVEFELETEDGNILSAKVCQDNRKALMSNPNSELGEWILRKVLDLEPGTLVTVDILVEKQIDSVLVEKHSDRKYKIRAHSSIQAGQQDMF